MLQQPETVNPYEMVEASLEICRRLKVPDIVFRVYPDVRENVAIRMILQPILENVFTHAYLGTNQMCVILITAREVAGKVEIRIEDHGVGMSGEKLKQLREQLAEPDRECEHGVGLVNVNRRIHLYFGNDYGLSVDSVQGEGTCVVVHLPKADVRKECKKLKLL